MENDLNYLENGLQPQCFGKWKTTSIFSKWKTFLGLAKFSKIVQHYNMFNIFNGGCSIVWFFTAPCYFLYWTFLLGYF